MMTQAQRILTLLDQHADRFLSFGEMHETLSDMPKGTLSALLVTMQKEGHADRRVRHTDHGRDVHEYQITDAGRKWMEEHKDAKPKRRRVALGSRTRPTKPADMSFAEVQKLAEHKDEYENLQKFIGFLEERDVLKKKRDAMDAVLEYIGVDATLFRQQTDTLRSILPNGQ